MQVGFMYFLNSVQIYIDIVQYKIIETMGCNGI